MRSFSLVGGKEVSSGNGPDDIGMSDSQEQDAQSKFTVLLLPGAGHKSSTWDLVRPLLEDQGHDVITPDFPNTNLDATLQTEIDIARDSIRGCKNIFAVSHSRRGILLSYLLDGMSKEEAREDYEQVRGAATVAYAGSHNIVLDPEEERYTKEFYEATGTDEKGRMIFKEGFFRDVFLNDVPSSELARKGENDTTAQTRLTDLEIDQTPLIPAEMPWYWFAGSLEKAHRISRVRRVVAHINRLRPDLPIEYYEMKSGHTPQLSIPATLSSVILYCASDASLKHLRATSS